MKENTLTDRNFWQTYWENKPGLVYEVKEDLLFGDVLTGLIRQHHPLSVIELGGFPGYYALYVKKFFGVKSALLDYFVHKPILSRILELNGLNESDIEVIETDLFESRAQTRYDLVCSFGLIEHFANVQPILEKHLEFMNPGGLLYLTLPNFLGVNGWVQKAFDPENLAKHNLATMNPGHLTRVLESIGLEVLQANYYGKFTVWLEDEPHKPLLARISKGLIWGLGKVITRPFTLQSSIFSPYIQVIARKPAPLVGRAV